MIDNLQRYVSRCTFELKGSEVLSLHESLMWLQGFKLALSKQLQEQKQKEKDKMVVTDITDKLNPKVVNETKVVNKKKTSRKKNIGNK